MMNKRTTKRALLLSALSLLMCVSMLIGSTFAWFTDSVTSGNNIIKSGTLDVEMNWREATDDATTPYTDASNGAIFNYDLWEPGYVEAKNIQISNVGTLALKYQLNIVATGTVSELANVIDVYYAEGEYTLTDRSMTELTKIGTLAEVLDGLSKTANGDLLAGESDTVTIALKMQESAGNEYQDLSIGSEFAIQLMATQLTYEEDSFDDQYDALAFVADVDALKAAIADGKNVVLAADMAVDANTSLVVADDSNILLDLNGHNITGVSDATGKNRPIFVVKGEMNVIGNGSITQSHTGANMGWSNLTAPFSVEGGVLTLNEGVTVTNLGGTDMAYAVDVNTTLGESVLNVDGATLYSTYVGVRIFNNHKTAKGIVNLNSGVINGAKNGYDIWAQLMSAPAENAVVNIADDINYTSEAKSGTMYYIDSDTAIVSTTAELTSAIAAGGEIVLVGDINDVNANTAINVPAGTTTTLDLNGHKISATADKTGNQELFLVKGNMTVKNGSMELTAKNNQGWGAMATIFDVTAGGALTMEGVTANVGGTDMNFIVHLNNWGSATLNVNECDFTASYVAIRAFNSGYDMNTVTVKNTDFHTGRMFWVHNYTAEGKDDTTLTLDIYGNGNTTDNEKPVRFGFSNSVYFDIDGNLIP